MIRRHHRFRVHVAAQVTSLMIPPAHPTASLCVPALVTGNQIDGGFYKGFFRSLLMPLGPSTPSVCREHELIGAGSIATMGRIARAARTGEHRSRSAYGNS